MDLKFLEDNAVILAILALWELCWKGLALWRAAQRGSKVWFIALLIINSVGILPIIYLLLTGGLSLTRTADKKTPENS